MAYLCEVSKYKIIAYEDDPYMQDAYKWMLNDHNQIILCGINKDLQLLNQQLESIKPDVVLMDINLAQSNGIEGIKKIRAFSNYIQIIVVTTFEDENIIFDAIQYGANGYLIKENIQENLIPSILEVMKEGSPLSPKIARKFINYYQKTLKHNSNVVKKEQAQNYQLTTREVQILQLVTTGMSSKMISGELFISELTVSNHIRHIYSKLQVHSRAEAVSKALKEKIV